MDRRVVTIVLAVAAVALSLAPVGAAARVHPFKARYTGTGSGQATATGASGHATASGTGNVIGPSRLTAAGTAVALSPGCFSFTGKFTLKGHGGKIVLRVHGDRVCASAGADVAFSGTATVTEGTRKFAGARGTLALSGVYTDATEAVTMSFKGRVTY